MVDRNLVEELLLLKSSVVKLAKTVSLRGGNPRTPLKVSAESGSKASSSTKGLLSGAKSAPSESITLKALARASFRNNRNNSKIGTDLP